MERTLPVALRIRPAYIGLGILAAAAAILTAASIATWSLVDLSAYVGAAERLRFGGELYPVSDPMASDTYRYAPWFAFAFVPATFLPRGLLEAAWTLVMAGSVIYCAWRVREHMVLALAFIPLLMIAASFGNIQPVLIAALLWKPTPWMAGIAGSLKVTPVLLTAGSWKGLVVAVSIAAILWLPALLFGIEHYPTSGGTLLVIPLWLHLGAAAVLAAACWRFPQHRHWLAPLAVIAAMPRFHLYDASYLLLAARDDA